MKKGLIQSTTALVLALTLVTGLCSAPALAVERLTPARSTNQWSFNLENDFRYLNGRPYKGSDGNGTRTSDSFLRAEDDGSFTLVAAYTSYDSVLNEDYSYERRHITLEHYDKDFNLVARAPLPLEMPRMLGCLIGEDDIYIAFTSATHNAEQLPEAEILRVVRYSKDGQQRLAGTSYTSGELDAIGIADFGSCEMVLDSGMLILRTTRQHFADGNGVVHQSSFTCALDKVTLEKQSVMDFAQTVSHAQALGVRSTANGPVFMDHTDATPRGVIINEMQYDYAAVGDDWGRTHTVMCAPGESGENYMGLTVGGFEVSSSSYLLAGTTIEMSKYDLCLTDRSDPETRSISTIPYQLYTTSVDRATGKSATNLITTVSKDGPEYLTMPQLVDLGGDSYLLLWGKWTLADQAAYKDYQTYGVLLDGQGRAKGEIAHLGAYLSGCQPVAKDGVVTWYVCEDRSYPMFYQLDTKTMTLTAKDLNRPYQSSRQSDAGDRSNFTYDTALAATFSDVAAGNWAADGIRTACQLGLMKGGNGAFRPDGTISIAEVVTLASRIHSTYTSGKAEFIQQGSPWYQVYVDYAKENGILTWEVGDLNAAATRAQLVQILDNALPITGFVRRNEFSQHSIPDVDVNADYAAAVYHFYRAGITVGDQQGGFSPARTITRAEVAVIVSRMADPTLAKSSPLHDFGPRDGWTAQRDPIDVFPFPYPPVMGWDGGGFQQPPAEETPEGPAEKPEEKPAETPEEKPAEKPAEKPETPPVKPPQVSKPGDFMDLDGYYHGMTKKPTVDYDPMYLTDTPTADAPAVHITGIEVVPYSTPYWEGYTLRFTTDAPADFAWTRFVNPSRGDEVFETYAASGQSVENGVFLHDYPQFLEYADESSRIVIGSYDDYSNPTQTWFRFCSGAMDVSGVTFTENRGGGDSTATFTGLAPNTWHIITGYTAAGGSLSSRTPVMAQSDSRGSLTVNTNITGDGIYVPFLQDVPSGATLLPAPTLVWPY